MALKRYAVEVAYMDRRDGPLRWRVTVPASRMHVALARGAQRFFAEASFRGRDPYKRLSVSAARIGGGNGKTL